MLHHRHDAPKVIPLLIPLEHRAVKTLTNAAEVQVRLKLSLTSLTRILHMKSQIGSLATILLQVSYHRVSKCPVRKMPVPL